MGRKSQRNFQWISIALSALVLASGCGKTSETSLPATGAAPSTDGYVGNPPGTGWTGGVSCGTGPYSFTDPNCLTDFVSACSRVGVVVSSTSNKTCAIPVGPVNVTDGTGILNPSDPSGPYAGSGLVVRAGDVVSFSGTGAWGTADVSTGTFLFDIFQYTWADFDCDQVNLKGRSDGHIGTYEGKPMGLIGAVSGTSQVFPMVSDYWNQNMISNNGFLRIGMNVPRDLAGICGTFSGTLYITVR